MSRVAGEAPLTAASSACSAALNGNTNEIARDRVVKAAGDRRLLARARGTRAAATARTPAATRRGPRAPARRSPRRGPRRPARRSASASSHSPARLQSSATNAPIPASIASASTNAQPAASSVFSASSASREITSAAQAAKARERVLFALERDAAGGEQHAHEHQRDAHRDDDGERVQRRATAVQQRALDADRLADRRQHALGEREVLRREARRTRSIRSSCVRTCPGGWRAMIPPQRRRDLAEADQVSGAPRTAEIAPAEQRADRRRRRPSGSVRRSRGWPARAPS